METTSTFFVAKKTQQTTIDLWGIYEIKWKELVWLDYRFLIEKYKDEEKIKKRRTKHFLLCTYPKNNQWFISSVYPEEQGYVFDYQNKYYKLEINLDHGVATIKKYNPLE